jgi:hypothetical protein
MKSFLSSSSIGLVLFATGLSLASYRASAAEREGTHTGGGGDASEEGFNEIRADLLKWIEGGGAKGLSFPNDMDYSTYVSSMTKVLAPHNVILSFVTTQQEELELGKSDPDFESVVRVDGERKTCRSFWSKKDAEPHILCNVERYEEIAKRDQGDLYRLVHHEYAGLSGTERNQGASSDYSLSNQLTDYLEQKTVLRLSVKKVSRPSHANDRVKTYSAQGKGRAVSEMFYSADFRAAPEAYNSAKGQAESKARLACLEDGNTVCEVKADVVVKYRVWGLFRKHAIYQVRVFVTGRQ